MEAIDLTQQYVTQTHSLQGINDDLTEDMMILYNAAECETCEQFQLIPLRRSNAVQIRPPVVFRRERKLLNRRTCQVQSP